MSQRHVEVIWKENSFSNRLAKVGQLFTFDKSIYLFINIEGTLTSIHSNRKINYYGNRKILDVRG